MKTKELLITLALLALAQPAFAGWYLMQPGADQYSVWTDWPMSKWEQISAFDTAGQCQRMLDKLSNKVVDLDPGWPAAEKFRKLQISDGRCVIDTDPRLQSR